MLYGVPRGVAGHNVGIQTTAVQYVDGSFNLTDDPPQVCIDISYYSALTSAQARSLANSLIDAADEVDGWAGR